MEILEGHNKFYVNDAEGNQVAEIVFVPTGEHLSIIEHTDVDPSLKGQGVGKQLVAKVVEKMRGENRKIIPLCPFAKHEFDNTREYDDIPGVKQMPGIAPGSILNPQTSPTHTAHPQSASAGYRWSGTVLMTGSGTSTASA